MASDNEGLDALLDRLREVNEELGDAAIARLRAALRTKDDDERERLRQEEKRITRARRAVEKAASLLNGME
jgi:hypothetical protein